MNSFVLFGDGAITRKKKMRETLHHDKCFVIRLDFVCLSRMYEQFFSNLVVVTISGDKTANLDLCFASVAYNTEDSLTFQTYSDTPHPKDLHTRSTVQRLDSNLRHKDNKI
jgi:hypothetical protein